MNSLQLLASAAIVSTLGCRVQVHLNKGKRKVYTRNGLGRTKRFSVIADKLDIPGRAIIDGEVVVIHEGRTNFSELKPNSPQVARTAGVPSLRTRWRLALSARSRSPE